MNTVFNIDRFLKVEKRSLFLSYRHLLYLWISLLGASLLSALLYFTLEVNLSMLIYVASIFFIITAPCLIEMKANKINGVFDFVLPGSTFEKFFSLWIKYVIIIPVSVFLILLVMNFITGLLPSETLREFTDGERIRLLNALNFRFLYKIFATQSLFMIGYFYFKRYAFVKVSLILILFSIVLSFIASFLMYYIFESQGIETTESLDVNITAGDMKGPIFDIVSWISGITLPLVAWVVCYFKLRETEI